MSALGDCFPVAFGLVLDNEGWRLCHGIVVRPEDGLHHEHAWAEFTTTEHVPMHDGSALVPVTMTIAVDRANGNDVMWPAEYYRKIGKAHNVVEYTRDEACRIALRAGHYGPW